VSNLVFLLIAFVLSVLGVGVLALRNRPSSSPHSSIDEFHDKMRALAPDGDEHGHVEDGVVRRRRKREG
jgi:hypothetical protein